MDKYTNKCTERCYLDIPIHPVKRSWGIWTHKVVYKISKKNFKKIFYLNLKHKFKETSCITQAHFDVLRMLISAMRRIGQPSKSGRLMPA